MPAASVRRRDMGDPEPKRHKGTQVENLCYGDQKGTQVANLCYGDREGTQVTNVRPRTGTVTLLSLPRLPLLASRRGGTVGR